MVNNSTKVSKAGTIGLIVCGCLIYAVSGGIRSSFGMVVTPISEHTGLTYAEVSFAAGVMQLLYGLSQPFWGTLALKRSNTTVLLVGIPLLAAGIIGTPLSHNVPAMTLFLGILFGVGSGALAFGMIMGAISPIIGQKRAAAASGILNASSGIGGSLFAPVMSILNQSVGIVRTMLILSVPVIVLLPIVLWIGRQGRDVSYASNSDDNEDYQDAGDGDGSAQQDVENQKAERNSIEIFKDAFRSPDYRALMIGFGTCGFHMCIIQTHYVSQMLASGISDNTAAVIYTAYGIFCMCGSVLSGVLCGKLHLKTVLGTLYGTRVFIVVALLLLPKTIPTFIFAALILGMTGDATVTPTSEIISRRFGPATMALLFGMTFVGHQIGGFISSWAGGIFITNSGNYTAIWMIDIVLCSLASFVSYRIRVRDGE